ncbi:MAG: hypothetical protein NUV63_03150 [Gallionella sp.]|nr:hypothetical protein [Gallionella sp.]
MAVAAKYTRFLFGDATAAFDFSGDSNSLSMALTVAPLQNTGFQATAETYIAGLTTGVISQKGNYSGKGAGYIEQEVNARLDTATAMYVAALFGTNVAGCPGYVTTQSWGQQMTMDMPIADLITLASEWPSSGQMIRGLRLTSVATQTVSATGALASVDFGAVGSAGGVGYLFITTITGTAVGATIDIESSATEGGVYLSEGTFTFSSTGIQVVALSGAVDRWLRLNITSLGTATSFVVTAIVGLSGVTY